MKNSSQEAEDFMILQAELEGSVSPFPWSLPPSTLELSSHDVDIIYCWTCKEAYLKALGDGLSKALDQFDVLLIPAEPVHLVNVEVDCDDATRWTLKALTPAPGYVAALAVEGHNWRTTFLTFLESTSEVCQSSKLLGFNKENFSRYLPIIRYFLPSVAFAKTVGGIMKVLSIDCS